MNHQYPLKQRGFQKTIPLIFIGAVFLFSFAVRIFLIPFDLPYYAIDENDVVEPALAFLSGDWDPRWYKYGPFFSYLLAGIYKLYQLFTGLSTDDFFFRAFFQQDIFFMIARSFHALILTGIVILSTLFAKKHYSLPTIILAAVLSLAPILDLINDFTVRVDTLQGFLSLLFIYIAVSFGKGKNRLAAYGLAGMVAGMNIAVKPLPGMLLLPTMLAAHILAVKDEQSPEEGSTFILLNGKLLIFIVSLIVAHAIVHPYSIINFKGFMLEQLSVFLDKSAQGGKLYGYDFRWLVPIWGVPLTMAAIGVLLSFWRWKDTPTRLLVFYTFTYCGVFLFFKTRMYWYNAVLPCFLILAARFVTDILHRFSGKQKSGFGWAAVISLVMIAHPAYQALLKTAQATPVPWSSVEKRCDRGAQAWIENNVSENSHILTIGFYSIHLPRLYAATIKNQAQWGEYFMYHRSDNVPWFFAFKNAYHRLKKMDKPFYSITNVRAYYTAHGMDQKANAFFQDSVDRFALKNGCTYIVTASPDGYTGRWEQNDTVLLIKKFNRAQGCRGDEVKIFKVTKQ